ncbi:MAG TPA: hypothetical protein VGK67_03350 [Myxococcales bacterium]|jgi:hypothetical protein
MDALTSQAPKAPGLLQTAELLLRTPDKLLDQVHEGGAATRELPARLILLSAIGFGAYGFIVGLARSPLQGLLAAPKLVFVALGSLVICLPALHVYGRLLGSKARLDEAVGEALTAIATAGMTLLALCPVLLVFTRIIAPTLGVYLYTILGAAALLAFACLRGIFVLFRAMRRGDRPAFHLLAWTALFGLVGLQCAWLVRPFIGAPSATPQALVLTRPLERTAFDALQRTASSAIETALSDRVAPR